jgi:hypothetical protein
MLIKEKFKNPLRAHNAIEIISIMLAPALEQVHHGQVQQHTWAVSKGPGLHSSEAVACGGGLFDFIAGGGGSRNELRGRTARERVGLADSDKR